MQSLGIYGEKCDKEHLSHSTKDEMGVELPPKEMIESLFNGDVTLPYTDRFELPAIVSCPGGCEEEQYCRFEKHFVLLPNLFVYFLDYVPNTCFPLN